MQPYRIVSLGPNPDVPGNGAVCNGFDRVRFLAPVRAGSQVRGRFRLDSAEEKAPGQILLRHNVTVEIEGEDKPALTADWLGLMFV